MRINLIFLYRYIQDRVNRMYLFDLQGMLTSIRIILCMGGHKALSFYLENATLYYKFFFDERNLKIHYKKWVLREIDDRKLNRNEINPRKNASRVYAIKIIQDINKSSDKGRTSVLLLLICFGLVFLVDISFGFEYTILGMLLIYSLVSILYEMIVLQMLIEKLKKIYIDINSEINRKIINRYDLGDSVLERLDRRRLMRIVKSDKVKKVCSL